MSQVMTTQREQSPQEVLRVQFDKMDGEIEKVLPEHVSLDKFKRVVLTAVSRNPDLMAADRRSLMAACLDAAQDGLIPDGREAALVVFNTKVKDPTTGKDVWIKKAQYMPMIYGVYKKVRNAGEISTLSAHVVYANDAFEYWVDEDGPHLRHTPILTGARGEVSLVYAVCKLKDGSVEIETMLKAEVEEVRAVSKSAGGPAWSKWWGEMARKTVVRRLSKRLPMSSDLERLMQRDDSMYDLEQTTATEGAPPRPTRDQFTGLADAAHKQIEAERQAEPTPPTQGEDFDAQARLHTTGHVNDDPDETESADGETEGAGSPEGEAATEQGREPVNQASVTPAPEREAADSAGQPPEISAQLTRLKDALAKKKTQKGIDDMLADKGAREAIGTLSDDELMIWHQAISNRRDEIEQMG